MFYGAVKNDHGLRYDPFKAIVAPRPIGWITSMNVKGEINLAPYSFFNGISSRPALVMFSSEGLKDSVSFIAETGEFVCNLATWDLHEAMNATSAPVPRGVNEMERAGLAPAPSRRVKPPRVAARPCALRLRPICGGGGGLRHDPPHRLNFDRPPVFNLKVIRKAQAPVTFWSQDSASSYFRG